MYIAILGRQPEFGMTELEALYGTEATSYVRDDVARIDSPSLDFNRLGGSQKAGRIAMDLPGLQWRELSKKVIQNYEQKWRDLDHKITFGISTYGFDRLSPREIQYMGITLKKRLRSHNVSLRLVPNDDVTLNTATSHHNKLGLSDNKVELLIIKAKSGKVIVAESIGSQNITAFAARDQGRPKRDAFVGMLPPKLARTMVNLSGLDASGDKKPLILDPFCGTGVILQEALIDGFRVAGSDLSEKMVDYTQQNLDWIIDKKELSRDQIINLKQTDAQKASWSHIGKIDAIVCEAYLGQPFSAPPSPPKLREVVGNCQHIIGTFLGNISSQLEPGTPLVVAVPAWRQTSGVITHLDLDTSHYGLKTRALHGSRPLLYYRDTQVVAREILLLEKA